MKGGEKTVMYGTWYVDLPILFMVPIRSMYGIFTYICLKFMVNVGKYSIHGAFGVCKEFITDMPIGSRYGIFIPKPYYFSLVYVGNLMEYVDTVMIRWKLLPPKNPMSYFNRFLFLVRLPIPMP